LFTQETYAKEETFGICSSSTLEEDHEARQESRHTMNKKRQHANLQGRNQKTAKLGWQAFKP
jgi:hypothetical protein